MAGGKRKAEFVISAENKASGTLAKVAGGVEGLKGKLGTLGKVAGGALAGFVTGAAVAGIARAIQSANDLTDSLRDSSIKLGIGVTDLQAYQLAAGNAGIENEKLEGSINKLNKAAGDLKLGITDADSTTAGAFRNIGISLDEVKKSSPAQLFERVVEGLGKIEDPAARASNAMAIFGKSGADVLTLVADGAGSLRESRELLEGLGLAISDVDASKVDAANDALGTLKVVAQAAMQKLGIELAPVIQAVGQTLLDAGKEGETLGQRISNGVSAAVTAVDRAVSAGRLLKASWDVVVNGAVGGFASVASSIYGAAATLFELRAKGNEAFNGLIEAAEGGTKKAAEGINGIVNAVVTGITGGLNAAITGIESLVNSAVKGLNTVIEAANKANPLGNIPTIGEVKLGSVEIKPPKINVDDIKFGRTETVAGDAAADLRRQQAIWDDVVNQQGKAVDDAKNRAGEAWDKMINGGNLQKNFNDSKNAVNELTKAVGGGGGTGEGGFAGGMKNAGKEAKILKAIVVDEAALMREELEKFQQAMAKQWGDFAKYGAAAMDGVERGIDQFVENGTFSFAEFTSSVLKDIAKIMLKSAILGQIFGSQQYGGNGTGGVFGGSGFGNFLTAVFAGGRSYDGGGYTGRGSRSGGMDGKGGFMAMLHPNESIIDHSKGQSAGGPVVVNQTVVVKETLESGIAARIAGAARDAALNAVRDIHQRGGARRAAYGL